MFPLFHRRSARSGRAISVEHQEDCQTNQTIPTSTRTSAILVAFRGTPAVPILSISSVSRNFPRYNRASFRGRGLFERPRHIRNGERPSKTVSFHRGNGCKNVRIRIWGKGGYSIHMWIHLMAIKVFTAPRRTPHFEIWHLGSSFAYQESPSTLFCLLSTIPRPSRRVPLYFAFYFMYLDSSGRIHARSTGSRYACIISSWFPILFTASFYMLLCNNWSRVQLDATVSPNCWKMENVVTGLVPVIPE